MLTIYLIFVAVAIVVLFPFFVSKLADMNIIVTRLETGDMKFIKKGETLDRIIYDIPEVELVGRKIVEASSILGIYWVGPFCNVHTFEIVKQKENPKGAGPDHWIEEGDPVVVSSLRHTIPRPYVLRDVELQDRVSVHVLVSAIWEVADPEKLVFSFKGGFFSQVESIMRASIITEIEPFTLDTFKNAPKSENDGILKNLKGDSDFNKMMVRQVGLRLVGISIPQWDPADPTVVKAMNANTVATLEAEALQTSTDAQVNSIIKLVEAKKREAAVLPEALGTVEGASGDAIVQAIAHIKGKEAIAGKDSKITTYAEGGTPAVLPIGGNNNGRR